MNRNDLAIVEVIDTDNTMFADENIMDLESINAITKKRRERIEMDRIIAEREYRLAEIKNRERVWRDYTIDSFSYIGVRGAIMGGSIWAMIAGMMHPIIAIPTAIFCLSTACIRLGMWFGSHSNKY